jgi:hypothetical protein
MTNAIDLGKVGLISNAVYNSITSNATAITAISVGTANISGNVVFGGIVTVTGNVTLGSSAFFVGNGVSITTVNATSITTGTLPDARLSSAVVNTSAAFTIAGIHTYQANILMGNTTVNTQISNAIILISNSTSTTTLGLTDIRIGNTTTNVVISNTTSTFGGNLTATGSISGANVTTTTNVATIGTAAYFAANGNVGIGTTTPAYKMNVNGSIGAFGDITSYRSASATTGALYLGNGGNYLYFNGTNFETSAFLQAAGSLRAPIFYDSEDTGYYCNPNGQSRLNYLNLNTGTWNYSSEGWARLNFVSGDTSYYRGGASNQWSHGFRTQDDVTRWLFEAGGNIYATGNIIAYWSDRRLKKNIKKIDDWRDIINGLNGYRFEWNDIGNKILENAEPGVQIGLIAQEVKAVLPQAASVQLLQYKNKEADGTLTPKDDINYDSEDPYLTVDEKKLIPVLVEAVKGLLGEVEDLKKQLKLLQKE